MTAPSPTTVQVGDDHITIDAELLAPKLGLTVNALRENMANGLVVSVAETGVDEDAGRTRLTFRYRARIWRVVIDVDGSLIEVQATLAKPPPNADPFSLPKLTKDAS